MACRPGMEGPLLLPLLLILFALLGCEHGAALSVGHKCDGHAWGTDRVAGAQVKVVQSSLELSQVLPPDTLPIRMITLTRSNKKIS